jgi:hypothetical protein
MKQKILELLKLKKQINLTDFHKLIPEIKGDFSMYLPVNDGYNKNILLLQNVKQDFIVAFNELQAEKIATLKPTNLLIYLSDGSPCYNEKLFNNNIAKKQTHCWQPAIITLIN